MKLSYFLLINCFLLQNLYMQEKSVPAIPEQSTTIQWHTIEEAEKLVRIKPKKIIIDVYTDWCGWCKKMDQNTFTHPVIVKMINDNFYAVKLNAETSDTMVFNGSKYISLSKGGRATHPLAISLLGWRISYPSFVYLTERLEYLGPIPGYKTPEQMEAILTFIAQDKFRTTSLEEFEKNFQGQIKQVAPVAPK